MAVHCRAFYTQYWSSVYSVYSVYSSSGHVLYRGNTFLRSNPPLRCTLYHVCLHPYIIAMSCVGTHYRVITGVTL